MLYNDHFGLLEANSSKVKAEHMWSHSIRKGVSRQRCSFKWCPVSTLSHLVREPSSHLAMLNDSSLDGADADIDAPSKGRQYSRVKAKKSTPYGRSTRRFVPTSSPSFHMPYPYRSNTRLGRPHPSKVAGVSQSPNGRAQRRFRINGRPTKRKA